MKVWDYDLCHTTQRKVKLSVGGEAAGCGTNITQRERERNGQERDGANGGEREWERGAREKESERETPNEAAEMGNCGRSIKKQR